MKKLILAAAVAAASLAPAANAAVIVTAVAATAVYSGPVPTFDFTTAVSVTGGQYQSVTSGGITKPKGATGNFLVVRPNTDNTFPGLNPATVDLTGLGPVDNISFLWGSRDTHNTVRLLDSVGSVLFSYSGAQLLALAGNVSGNSYLVKFHITDVPTQDAIAGLRLETRFNPFEIDNLYIHAVPEMSTWMLMLLGFGAVGFAMRQRKVRVQFA